MRRSWTFSADAIVASAPPEGQGGGSPFEAALGEHRRELARPLLMQFFGSDPRHRVRMDGVMHRVWHRHAWLRPFFVMLAWVDIFFPETGRDVPASMIVTPTAGGFAWRRTFWFPRVRRFNATMTWRASPSSSGLRMPPPLSPRSQAPGDPGLGEGRVGARGSVIERVGPAGLLEIPWTLRLHHRDLLEITTQRLMIHAGPVRFRVPSFMQVAVRVLERAVDDAIHVDLVLSHRWLGPMFGYDGAFTVRREALDGTPLVDVDRRMRAFAPWFYAAAVYNLAWGALAILRPAWFFETIHAARPNNLAIWQALGMMVLVYAPAYWWVGNDPVRHRHLVVIAMLGKLLGPLGFTWGVATHALPLAFGLTILTNDLLWWPAFMVFLTLAARASGGWRNLLLGR